MKRRTLFAVALSGILLRASEVLGIEAPVSKSKELRVESRLLDGDFTRDIRDRFEYRVVDENGEVVMVGDEAREFSSELSYQLGWRGHECHRMLIGSPETWNSVAYRNSFR